LIPRGLPRVDCRHTARYTAPSGICVGAKLLLREPIVRHTRRPAKPEPRIKLASLDPDRPGTHSDARDDSGADQPPNGLLADAKAIGRLRDGQQSTFWGSRGHRAQNWAQEELKIGALACPAARGAASTPLTSRRIERIPH
jgi:hypothetical protein